MSRKPVNRTNRGVNRSTLFNGFSCKPNCKKFCSVYNSVYNSVYTFFTDNQLIKSIVNQVNQKKAKNKFFRAVPKTGVPIYAREKRKIRYIGKVRFTVYK